MQTFENATSLGGSPGNVVITGLSAGANFASINFTSILEVSTVQQ
jgi:acetyl esterase/lipase